MEEGRRKLSEEKASVRRLEEEKADSEARNDDLRRKLAKAEAASDVSVGSEAAWQRTKARLETALSEANDSMSIVQVIHARNGRGSELHYFGLRGGGP